MAQQQAQAQQAQAQRAPAQQAQAQQAQAQLTAQQQAQLRAQQQRAQLLAQQQAQAQQAPAQQAQAQRAPAQQAQTQQTQAQLRAELRAQKAQHWAQRLRAQHWAQQAQAQQAQAQQQAQQQAPAQQAQAQQAQAQQQAQQAQAQQAQAQVQYTGRPFAKRKRSEPHEELESVDTILFDEEESTCSTIVNGFMSRGRPGLEAALRDHHRDIKLRIQSLTLATLAKTKAREVELEKRLTEEKSRANEAEAKSKATSQCVVCKEAPRDTLLTPCNHFVMCATCAYNRTVKNCPVCRRDIEDRMKVYT